MRTLYGISGSGLELWVGEEIAHRLLKVACRAHVPPHGQDAVLEGSWDLISSNWGYLQLYVLSHMSATEYFGSTCLGLTGSSEFVGASFHKSPNTKSVLKLV